MVNICKGTCAKYAIGSKRLTIERILTGHKKCMICDVVIKNPDKHCPCCGHQVRATLRTAHGKRSLIAVQGLAYI